MSKKYQEYVGKIPAYLADQMAVEERRDFEAFADTHPELQRELQELSETFGWLRSEMQEAGRTDFRLSPARRATVRRETDANVISFPGTPVPATTRSVRRRWLSATLAAAASLLLILNIGQDVTRELDVVSDPGQLATESAAEETSALRLYEYPQGYGLDRPEPWRVAGGVQVASLGSAYVGAEISYQPRESWHPSLLGMDGPRPYYSFSPLRGPGAI